MLAPSLPSPAVPAGATPAPLAPTLRSYYETWIAEQTPRIRPALLREYTRHFTSYILPTLGDLPLTALRPKDVRGLQAELLAREHAPRKGYETSGTRLSVKTVRNALAGSFRALWRQVRADEPETVDLFVGLTWPQWDPPEADPLTPDDMRRILGWFRTHRFGFAPLLGSMGVRRLLHPPFHAYVLALFTTGLRPSEASGLQWQDIDLAQGLLYVRRSFHRYTYGAPKTRSARRTVELLAETVRVLRDLQPLHVAPETPVFMSTLGGPIDPKRFGALWGTALRACGIRARGLYATKDTFVSLALRVRGPLWVERQTGVAYATLRKHYAKWMPQEDDRAELARLSAAFGVSRGSERTELSPHKTGRGDNMHQVRENAAINECRGRDSNPHGVAPTEF